jgi:hypothetical protein
MTADILTKLASADPHAVRAWVVKITSVTPAAGYCTIDPADGGLVQEVPYWGGAPAVGSVQVALLFDGLLGVVSAGGASSSPVSGTWPNAPGLDFWSGGEVLSTDGLPIYLDTAGQLRARPDVYKPAAKGVDDPISTYPIGVSVMAVSGALATAGGWPFAGSAVVVTFNRSKDAVGEQWWHSNSVTNQRVLYRHGNNASTPQWGAWVQTAGFQSAMTAATADLAVPNANTNVPGMAVALTVPLATSVYMVQCNFDVQTTATASGTFIGRLSVGGNIQGAQANWGVPGAAANFRNSCSQTWKVTGLTPGSTTFQAVASCSQSGTTYRVNGTATPGHSIIAVWQIA